MGYLDIIVYAAIAAFAIARLWSVLGRRNDDEPQQPNPFAKPAPRAGEEDDLVITRDKSKVQAGVADAPPALPSPLLKPVTHAPASLAGGLAQVQGLDANFDEKKFIIGAKAAFEMIVGDFAKGDLSRIGRLLAPPVLDNFTKAIAALQAARETLTNKIDRIADAHVTAARVEGSRAFMTVRFVSYQSNVLTDASGVVVSGHPGQLDEVDDIWVFARDLKAGDPNWILAETKG